MYMKNKLFCSLKNHKYLLPFINGLYINVPQPMGHKAELSPGSEGCGTLPVPVNVPWGLAPDVGRD